MAFITGGLGGFKHRLSKMYQDTKNLYDFTEPPKVSEAPELSSLHRKLRIQKDRLIAWGLQWSDKSGEKGQPADIDESLDKAGLGDVVGSVLATIKEIIAEADPLWQSSRALLHVRGLGDEKLLLGAGVVGIGLSRTVSEKAVERRPSFVQWDRARFEGLIHELTISIDTLYDISRNRQRPSSARPVLDSKQSSAFASTSSIETFLESNQGSIFESSSSIDTSLSRTTQFESSRMQTPKQIDPEILFFPGDPDGNFLKSSRYTSEPRQIVYMRRKHTSNNPWKLGDGRIPLVPVLLEYAVFDAIFADTGIPPPMDRFEKLFAGLQSGLRSSLQKTTHQHEVSVPNLIGYFEDVEGNRFGLIYELPRQFGPVDEADFNERLRPPLISSLSDLLKMNTSPPLEDKFRLACHLAVTVFKLLAKDIIHGNLASDNVLFFSNTKSAINVRHPFLTNFDLFSGFGDCYYYEDFVEVPEQIHANASPKETGRAMDLRGLALLLIEIGLWTPMEMLVSTNEDLKFSEADLMGPSVLCTRIAAQCGTRYLRAVQACWQGSNLEMQTSQRESELQLRGWKVVRALEKCCAIDEDFEFENNESDDPIARADPVAKAYASQQAAEKTPTRPAGAISDVFRDEKSRTHVREPTPRTPSVSEKAGLYGPPSTSKIDTSIKTVVPAQKRKLRLFPTTNISQQHWDDWHDVLMPRINHLLRGFYRKHPESVEISLVSMGETPQKTKPTILAICTSVNQVKSILKKSFSFDKSVYNLKVCKGKILRSRKNRPPTRSMVDALSIDDESPAVNTEHQKHPRFGASIGASIEGHNLAPVSLGGILNIDGTYYGMSVHHMLDDDYDDEEENNPDDPLNPHRSSGYSAGSDKEGAFYYSSSDDVLYSGTDSEYPSDYETETEDESTTNTTSAQSFTEPGDKEGIPVDCGDGYVVTQPAIDDIPENWFSSEEAKDEEHIDSHGLGEMYASSGIRRTKMNGQTHEIDWSLFTFKKDRLPPPTLMQEGQKRFCKTLESPQSYPSGVVPTSELRDLAVHCMGRSSGLRAGRISTGMTSVKIYGRKTPSQSYEVTCTESTGNLLGIPGDSGAWVVEDGKGRVCGSVLAWSQRKRVAYICPMEVLVEDIARTVEAGRIALVGGGVLVDKGEEVGGEWNEVGDINMVEVGYEDDDEDSADSDDDADDEDEDDEDNDTKTVSSFKLSSRPQIPGLGSGSSPTTPTAPIRIFAPNPNTSNPRHPSTKERDIPESLIPVMDKMNGTSLALRSSKRVSAVPIAGSVK